MSKGPFFVSNDATECPYAVVQLAKCNRYAMNDKKKVSETRKEFVWRGSYSKGALYAKHHHHATTYQFAYLSRGY